MKSFVVRIDHGIYCHKVAVRARSHEEAFAEAERVLGLTNAEGSVTPK